MFIARRRVENDETYGETATRRWRPTTTPTSYPSARDAFAESSAFGAEVPRDYRKGDVSRPRAVFVRRATVRASEGRPRRARGAERVRERAEKELMAADSLKGVAVRRRSEETIALIVEENPRLRGMTTRAAPSSAR